MSNNLRIVLPQWQGGMNPNYRLGAKLLNALVPESQQTETLEIPVSDKRHSADTVVDEEESLLNQMETTFDTLSIKNPDKVITLGGDCSISEAPFDYLHGKYPNNFGVIWLDAHPDVSDPTTSRHIHEIVAANLMHRGAEKFNKQVKNPIEPKNFLFAGLKYDELRPMDQLIKELDMSYIVPEDLKKDSQPILNWIKKNNIKHIAIHLDLDVLDPDDFRETIPSEVGIDRSKFPYAIGSMKLAELLRLLKDIDNNADVVGMSMAEHMPWDAINLHNGLSELSIFD